MKNKTKHLSDVSLDFMGKDYAKEQAEASIQTSLVQDEEHNALPENASSENMFITGDNLEALKHLLNTHANKIKMIYIDPPYNTGNKKGFQYNDCFEFTKEDLITKLNYSEEDAKAFRKRYGKASHSAWLTFIYPRLKLARKLLSEDGVIFVSIDDNEQANLKLLMDDVFGEGNFVATFIIDKTAQGANQSSTFKTQHEYCLLYKVRDDSRINSCIADVMDESKYRMHDDRGFYAITNSFDSINSPLTKNTNRGYTIYYNPETTDAVTRNEYNTHKNTFFDYDTKLLAQGYVPIRPGVRNGVQYPWNWTSSRFMEEFKQELVFRKNRKNKWNVYHKNRSTGTKKDTTIKKFDTRSDGNNSLVSLMDGKVFDYPKSIEMMKWILSKITDKDFFVLDFFAGSATTAHAVMQLNAEDGGNRKYIMVQLNEEVGLDSAAENAGYGSIDDIARDRIERAAKQIKEKAGLLSKDLDLGFKHYRLVKSKE